MDLGSWIRSSLLLSACHSRRSCSRGYVSASGVRRSVFIKDNVSDLTFRCCTSHDLSLEHPGVAHADWLSDMVTDPAWLPGQHLTAPNPPLGHSASSHSIGSNSASLNPSKSTDWQSILWPSENEALHDHDMPIAVNEEPLLSYLSDEYDLTGSDFKLERPLVPEVKKTDHAAPLLREHSPDAPLTKSDPFDDVSASSGNDDSDDPDFDLRLPRTRRPTPRTRAKKTKVISENSVDDSRQITEHLQQSHSGSEQTTHSRPRIPLKIKQPLVPEVKKEDHVVAMQREHAPNAPFTQSRPSSLGPSSHHGPVLPLSRQNSAPVLVISGSKLKRVKSEDGKWAFKLPESKGGDNPNWEYLTVREALSPQEFDMYITTKTMLNRMDVGLKEKFLATLKDEAGSLSNHEKEILDLAVRWIDSLRSHGGGVGNFKNKLSKKKLEQVRQFLRFEREQKRTELLAQNPEATAAFRRGQWAENRITLAKKRRQDIENGKTPRGVKRPRKTIAQEAEDSDLDSM